MSFVLSCCSTSDLNKDYLLQRKINYICFNYFIDDHLYKAAFGTSVKYKDIYTLMRNGSKTKTSQINPDEFVKYFSTFLESGLDILHISLSSGISGVFNSANIAKSKLEKIFPDRKILIVDSLAASSGYGLLIDRAADMRDENKNINEIYEWLEKNKLKVHHWFFTSDLSFFIKGGRIPKISGWFGTVLKICPLLDVNCEGKLIPRFKVRGKQKVIELTLKQMELNAKNHLDYAQKCFISHSDCYEDAKILADMVEKKFLKLDGCVKIFDIGTTIGSHTGPGTVALFFWGQERKK